MLDVAFSTIQIRSVLFQLLRQCNYKCAHCSQDAPHISDMKFSPVPLHTVIEQLNTLIDAGLERVRFTGGEPLLHPNLAEVVRYAKSRHLNTSIVTNGALLLHHALSLADAGVDSVWISVYGVSDEAYDAVAGRNIPAEAISEAITLLTAHAVKVCLYCTISLDAIGTDDFSMLDRLVASGVEKIRFLQFMEQGRYAGLGGERADALIRAGLKRLRIYRDQHPDLSVSVSMRSGQTQFFKDEGFRVPESVGCTAGSPDIWGLTANGSIKPCCLMLSDTLDKHTHGDSMTVPLRFLPTALHRDWRSIIGKGGACPALPEYPEEGKDQFVCPLVYAAA